MQLHIFYVGSLFSETTKWAVGSYMKISVFGPNVGKDIGNDAYWAFYFKQQQILLGWRVAAPKTPNILQDVFSYNGIYLIIILFFLWLYMCVFV